MVPVIGNNFPLLGAAATVGLAEQDTLSRRRIRGGVGRVRACPYPYNTHLAVQLGANICVSMRTAQKARP